MSDMEQGTCAMCNTPRVPLTRKYYYYAIHCECCNGNHFEYTQHCKNCTPKPRKFVSAAMTPMKEAPHG